MNRSLGISLIVLAGVGVVVALTAIYRFSFLNGGDVIPVVTATGVKNMSYSISGETFTLVNGKAEKEIAPDSATKNVLTMFGEPVYGDLNDDGDADAAIMLVNDPGGSGSFFYAVLAIKTGYTYTATNALLLGDRIAPQTVEIHDGRAVYNYAMRRADEPMTAQPSIGKSLWIQYDKATGNIGEWVKDFEGETNTVLNEAQARAIAERTCIKGGEALGPGIHNTGTRTWWFDANLNAARPGCNPACVVSEDKETAAVNWRCTGLNPTPVLCTAAQRGATCSGALDAASPVCATVNIQCIKAPCYPVQQTYANSCEACKNSLIPSYVSGACPLPSEVSGVKGKVLLGPTCPVMRDPPDPQCADKPYVTTVQAIEVGSPKSSPYATAKTGADGVYEVVLPPGTYALQPVGGQPFPRCETKEVTVVAGKMLEADLSCDTGIR